MAKKQILVHVPQRSSASLRLRKFMWEADFKGGLDQSEIALSEAIFGFDSVLAILRKAFQLGLTRDAVWDISQIEEHMRPSFAMAAKVFKRGASVAGADISLDSLTCTIKFVSSLEETFAECHNHDLFIVDQEVAKSWSSHLPSGFLPFSFSEAGKNINQLADLVSKLRERRAIINDVVVIGGGVAGDMAGFACGLLEIPWHFVPTTLLSMVDSSVGGKVAINFEPWGKNQLGLFYHAASVHIWSGWLSTLGLPEIRSGLAEALKHAILSKNKPLWDLLIGTAKASDFSHLERLLHDVVAIKVAVVMRDPFEDGERAILNFGHTLGHAVETLSGRKGLKLTHGTCVALGMIHALRISERRLGYASEPFIRDLLTADLLPKKSDLVEILNYSPEEIVNLMAGDKKNKDSKSAINFILLSDSGNPYRGSQGQWFMSIPREHVVQEVAETFRFLAQLA